MSKKTAKEFSRRQIWKIATDYAKTEYKYSCDYYQREFQISKWTFYTILEKAVVEHIVDMETVELMAIKARYNSSIKAGEAGAERSRKHYDYLKRKRALYRMSKKQATKWTIQYAESKLNKKEFAKRSCITTQLLDVTIKEAIERSWVSDEIVGKLKEKSLLQYNSQRVLDFWNELELARRNNKNQG